MRFHLQDLLEKHQFPCIRRAADETRTEAALVFVTPEVMENAESPDEGAPGSVEADAGSVIAVWQGEDGPECRIFAPDRLESGLEDFGCGAVFTLRPDAGEDGTEFADEPEMELLSEEGGNMGIWFRTHSWLYGQMAADTVSDGLREMLRESLGSIASTVAASTGSRPWMQNAAMMATAETFGDRPLPEGFERYIHAKALKATIARYDPGHPDAGKDLSEVTDAVAVRLGRAASLSAGAAHRHAAVSMHDESFRRAVQGNERLCREVFAKVTRCPPEDLSVSLLSPSDHDRLKDELRKRGELLSGEWTTEIHRNFKEVTDAAMPGAGYDFQSCIASAEGHDILLISENSETLGAAPQAYLYSWPQEDRLHTMEAKAENGSWTMSTISPEEIPDEAEIVRLAGELDGVRPQMDDAPAPQ